MEEKEKKIAETMFNMAFYTFIDRMKEIFGEDVNIVMSVMTNKCHSTAVYSKDPVVLIANLAELLEEEKLSLEIKLAQKFIIESKNKGGYKMKIMNYLQLVLCVLVFLAVAALSVKNIMAGNIGLLGIAFIVSLLILTGLMVLFAWGEIKNYNDNNNRIN